MKIHRDFVQVIDNEPTEEWIRARLGRPTASEFSHILAATAGTGWLCLAPNGETCGIKTAHRTKEAAVECCKKGNLRLVDPKNGFVPTPAPIELSAAAFGYACRLAGERVSGEPEDLKPFTNHHTQRGSAWENSGRAAYRLKTGIRTETVGFVESDCGSYGCSPDALGYEEDNDDNDKPDGGVEVKCPTRGLLLEWMEAGVVPLEHKVQVHGCMMVTGAKWWDFVGFHSTWADDPDKLFVKRVYPDEFTANLGKAVRRFVSEMLNPLTLKYGGKPWPLQPTPSSSAA